MRNPIVRARLRHVLPIRALALVAMGEAIVVGSQLAFLRAPLSPDESVYYTVAEHGMPYVATFDQKPPLIYAWYKLALLLNGGAASPVVIHALAMCVLAVTAVLVFYLGRALVDARLGAVGSVMFGVLVANPFVAREANTEVFALLWLVLGALALARGLSADRARWFLLTGFMAGLAVLTKTTMVFIAAAPAVCLFSYRPVFTALRRLALTGVTGCGVVLAGISPWLITSNFGSFWYANVVFNVRYSSSVPLIERPLFIAFGTLSASLASMIVLVGVAYGLRRSAVPDSPRRFLLWWMVGGLVATFFTGLVLRYYFVALFPSLALVSAAGFLDLASRWNRRKSRLRAYLALGPATIVMLVVLSAVDMRSSQDAYVMRFSLRANSGLLASSLIGATSGQARPDDRLMVVGDGLQIYAMSGLQPAARVFATPMLELDPALIPETLGQVEAANPRILVQIQQSSPSGSERTIEEAFAPLFSHYHLVYSAEADGASGGIWLRD